MIALLSDALTFGVLWVASIAAGGLLNLALNGLEARGVTGWFASLARRAARAPAVVAAFVFAAFATTLLWLVGLDSVECAEEYAAFVRENEGRKP